MMRVLTNLLWPAFALCLSWSLFIESEANGAASSAELPAIERIEVRPNQIKFTSAREQAILLVSGYDADGHAIDLTRHVEYAAADPSVVTIGSDGLARPVGNGATQIELKIGDQQTSAAVVVEGFDQPSPVSFRTETVAVLTRHGCNSGGCHGAPSGKGGFRLSLEAYDHGLDTLTLTREVFGRRTNTTNPTESLLLLKPTMTVAHGGGMRLRSTDDTYDMLRRWIGEGCQVDPPEGRRCVELELLPAAGRVLKHPHTQQQIVARAHFEDGSISDVTHLTKFSSSDSTVATINPTGLITGNRRGQVAIMARYLDKLVACNFTFVRDVEGFVWSNPPVDNYIDESVYEKLQQLQYPPAELCLDYEFIRRGYLDVIGLLPSIDEVNRFLSDSQPDRRRRLVDELLERPEFAQFWALKWGDLLRLQKTEMTESGVHKFRQWLVDVFQNNVPFDQFARGLLTAQGSTFSNPAANYYRACDKMDEATETTAQLFLGSRIQCAKCHNHPFENWTQDNYYGLTAFFNRVRSKPGLRADELIVFVSRDGEVHQPRTGQLMKPWLPRKGDQEDNGQYDRRESFATWLTSPTNPFFARVAVNRIWAHLFGRGIVEPVDDFRESNPPAIPTLLEKLAADFVEHDYDQKHILRTILNSHTYQLSSQTNELNREDTQFFSHAYQQMLGAEQLLDAICHVTQVPEEFAGLPAGTRATQLPSPDFKHEFLEAFGRPNRNTSCDCERSSETTLAQAIQLFNGPLIHRQIGDPQNRFQRQLAAERPHEEILDELYLAALSRQPSEVEMKTAMDHITGKEKPAEGFEDVCWALLNTNEFLTRH